MYNYILTFLEGVATFISPCLLPLLPVYVAYFAGGEEKTALKTLKNSLGFVCGFTAVFVLLGALAGSVGSFFKSHSVILNIITGVIVIFFGLSFLGVFSLNIFKGIRGKENKRDPGFFSALIFGASFSVGWTPCVGVFLGSALMMASREGEVTKGVIMLLLYSLGLGIPFVVSALLIDKLKGVFDSVKKHYGIINKVCGVLLIVLGILMATGLYTRVMSLISLKFGS